MKYAASQTALLVNDHQWFYILRDMFSPVMQDNAAQISRTIGNLHHALSPCMHTVNVMYAVSIADRSKAFAATFSKKTRPLSYDFATLKIFTENGETLAGKSPLQCDIIHQGYENQPLLVKNTSNAFADGRLARHLDDRSIRSVILAGGYPETCIHWSGEAARDHGFHIVLPMDAIYNHNPASSKRQLMRDNAAILKNSRFYAKATKTDTRQVIAHFRRDTP